MKRRPKPQASGGAEDGLKRFSSAANPICDGHDGVLASFILRRARQLGERLAKAAML